MDYYNVIILIYRVYPLFTIGGSLFIKANTIWVINISRVKIGWLFAVANHTIRKQDKRDPKTK
jgi:hypothetical protein